MTNDIISHVSQSIVPSFGPSPHLYVEHHESSIPEHAQALLHDLYGNVHSSMPHFQVYGGLDDASTFILRGEQKPVAVLLFRAEGNELKVLNEGMEIDDRTISHFSEFIFRQYAAVDFISYHGIAHASRNLDFPFSQCFCTDDSVIDLPGSPDAYLRSLGKATRKNITQYLNRIKRDHPTFELRVHEGATVDEALIRDIVAFNRLRFKNKGKVSAVTADEEERIIAMVRACGIIGAVSIDGRLCAGSIIYRIGEHYHSWLKAHDPAYDDYRLGLLTSFLMISECIQRGGKAYHLMWGREPHKALLNSELRIFSNLTVYRNHAAALRNCGILFRQAYQNGMRQGKLWLLEMEKGSGRMSYPIKAGMKGMRKVKTWLPLRD